MSETILITGASRGLGLAIARALDRQGDVALVLAVRDPAAMTRHLPSFRRPPRLVRLDVSRLAEVEAFAASWNEPLAALVNNAGLQVPGPLRLTAEGIETTLAVNHLAPLALAMGLRPHLAGGLVLGIGSGTHNPANPVAGLFGFRGGRFTSIAGLAAGEADGAASLRQQAMDRYATSKLLAMATTVEMARRDPAVRFACLDPGLMPGTGLAREAPAPVRLVWSTVLRAAVPLLPDASTPARSAAAAVRLIAGGAESGGIYDFTGGPSHRVWSKVREPAFGRQVVDDSLAFLAARR
ncbi:MAG: SDR family NAD(P)-dependent oxidoreductase [Reyranellaceae bacterium]